MNFCKPKYERHILLTALLSLIACSPSQEEEKIPELDADHASQNDTVASRANIEEKWVNPFPSYCFERIGQIGADGRVDQPRRGDICDVHGGGAGGLEKGKGSDPRNTAVIHISSPSLKAVGVKHFSFSLNRNSEDPKFTTGVHVMDQYDSRDMAEDNPMDAVLPDRLAFGSDLTGENSMFTHTTPDAARLRALADEIDFTGYEIASAVLTIDVTRDVPMDDSKVEYARQANMVIGSQYVTGTLSISLIPIGRTGSQYGPTTFEFGRTIDWGYSKSLYDSE